MLKYDATGNHLGSFVLKAMIPTYRACAGEHGTGMQARMHEIMARKMGSGSIFPYIHKQMKEGMEHWLDDMKSTFNNHIIKMCADLERHFETAGGTEAEEVRRENPRYLEAVETALTLGRETLPKLQQLASAGVAEARKDGYIL